MMTNSIVARPAGRWLRLLVLRLRGHRGSAAAVHNTVVRRLPSHNLTLSGDLPDRRFQYDSRRVILCSVRFELQRNGHPSR